MQAITSLSRAPMMSVIFLALSAINGMLIFHATPVPLAAIYGVVMALVLALFMVWDKPGASAGAFWVISVCGFCMLMVMTGVAIGRSHGALLGVLTTLAFLIIAAAALMTRYSFSIVQSGDVIVKRPPNEVFAALVPRATKSYWKPHAHVIEPILEDEGIFQFRFDYAGAKGNEHQQFRLIDMVENESFTTISMPSGEPGDASRGAQELMEYRFEAVPGGTRIRCTSTIDMAPGFLWLISICMQPQQDQLFQFKAILEGTKDISLANALME